MDEVKCEKDQTCETCNQSNTCSQQKKEAHAQERLKSKLSYIRHRIMVMSGKGGFGKSTVAKFFNQSRLMLPLGFKVK